MKTVIFGGSFNPVHNGHLYMAEELKLQMGYERVIFVPSNIPAHKAVHDFVPGFQRHDMLMLAIEKSYMVVDTCEIDRGGTSYMIDTVKHIEKKYHLEDEPIGLFIGDDLIDGLDRWKDVDALLDRVNLVVSQRVSADVSNITCDLLNNMVINISSSAIRNQIKKGYAFRYLVHKRVYTYLMLNHLYK